MLQWYEPNNEEAYSCHSVCYRIVPGIHVGVFSTIFAILVVSTEDGVTEIPVVIIYVDGELQRCYESLEDSFTSNWLQTPGLKI
jgi:hypothetical protein